jgi:hypothetical protein
VVLESTAPKLVMTLPPTALQSLSGTGCGWAFAAGLLRLLARKAASKIARVANIAMRAILEIMTISFFGLRAPTI